MFQFFVETLGFTRPKTITRQIKAKTKIKCSKKRFTRDMSCRFHNLIANLKNTKMNLLEASGHCFFMEASEVMAMITSFCKNANPESIKEFTMLMKAKYPEITDWSHCFEANVKMLVVEVVTSKSSRRGSGSSTGTQSTSKKVSQQHQVAQQEILANQLEDTQISDPYDTAKFFDLIRFMRNKHEHWRENNSTRMISLFGDRPENFLSYFTKQYPAIVTAVYVSSSRWGIYGSKNIRHMSTDLSEDCLNESILIGVHAPTEKEDKIMNNEWVAKPQRMDSSIAIVDDATDS